MDYLQLKMSPGRALAIADALDRDIEHNPEHPDRGELSHAAIWLRHRLALHELRTTTTTPGANSD